MNKNHVSVLFRFSVLFLLLNATIVHAQSMEGAVFANPCAGCHGPNGSSPGSIPSLSTLSGKYIQTSMQAFKTEKRKGTVMNRIAKGYSEQEIKLIADYFDSLRK